MINQNDNLHRMFKTYKEIGDLQRTVPKKSILFFGFNHIKKIRYIEVAQEIKIVERVI